MRIHTHPSFVACFAILTVSPYAFAQPPGAEGKPEKNPAGKPQPDEFRVLVKEVEEAYKAPLEVDEDIRDELQKLYKQPSPEREAKIFAEIRRLYQTTPAQEDAILSEIRVGYSRPSPEQEARIFAEIRRGGKLPLGTVPEGLQAEQSVRMFRKFDLNNDGVLRDDELPETLRGQEAKWDRNGNGTIDAEEYREYYQARLKVVSDGVASGQIPIKLPKGATVQDLIAKDNDQRPPGQRPAKPPAALPRWFAEYDADNDGQVGLYEWRRTGGRIAAFEPMDRNGDGYITLAELTAYLTEQARETASEPVRNGPPKGP